LIFEVELLEIVKAPESAKAAPKAKKK